MPIVAGPEERRPADGVGGVGGARRERQELAKHAQRAGPGSVMDRRAAVGVWGVRRTAGGEQQLRAAVVVHTAAAAKPRLTIANGHMV